MRILYSLFIHLHSPSLNNASRLSVESDCHQLDFRLRNLAFQTEEPKANPAHFEPPQIPVDTPAQAAPMVAAGPNFGLVAVLFLSASLDTS